MGGSISKNLLNQNEEETAAIKLPDYKCIKLNNFLVRNIISYVEPKVIVNKLMFLNKALYKLLDLKCKQATIEFNYLLSGRQDMNDLYCSFDLNDMTKDSDVTNRNLLSIEFLIESKDQGWASVNCSSSWVELKLFKKGNDNHPLAHTNLVFNFKEQNYKSTIIKFNAADENMKKIIDKIKETDDCVMKIFARSMYPGWVCYIRKVKAKFSFFDINLG